MRHIRGAMLGACSVIAAIVAPVAASPGAQAAPATLPVVTTFAPGDFPESLAVDAHGNLYASLGFLGEVVKVTPRGQQRPLAHLDVGAGLLTPLRTGGEAGTPQVLDQANLLRTADGIAFDAHGNLYITVNNNRLVRLAPDGALTELAAKNNGLVCPTMPAFGATPATRATLYITNDALDNGTPNIVAYDARGPGLPLP